MTETATDTPADDHVEHLVDAIIAAINFEDTP